MLTVNRSALTVKPKQPLVDWVNSVEPTNPITLRQAVEEPTIYLVREPGVTEDPADIVKEVYNEIFVEELAACYTDKQCWPKDRSFAVFRRWFDWEFHSMLVDLSDAPLTREVD